jgi:putative ABC transport system permease protein
VRSDTEDIREEIELHLELRAQELIREGVSPDEARRLAEERFGDVARIEGTLRRDRRRSRRRVGRGAMASLKQDLSFALRTFRRNPGFVVVAVLTLGIALGGNTAIFSVVDAALLQALPFPHHQGLVVLEGYQDLNGEKAVRGASVPEFRDWQQRSNTVTLMAAVGQPTMTLTGDGQAERVNGEVVSGEYFRILGVDAALGRTFSEDETVPDAHPVALLSWNLWQRRYGGDTGVVGRDIEIDDRSVTVVGVLPRGFQGIGLTTDVFLPMAVTYGEATREDRGARFLTVVGRLAPGVTIGTAQAELDGIAGDLAGEYPQTNHDRGCRIRTFRDFYLGTTLGSSLGASAGTTARLLWVLLGAGGVLLLIAAANVSNLLLVRAHARTREIVIRRALGADPSRVVRQLLTESLMLALIGGVVGVVLGAWGLTLLVRFIPTGVLPGYVSPTLNPRVFAFSFVVLAMAGVLAGVAPALVAARVHIAPTLREGGAGAATGGGLGRLRARHLFVVLQVALALSLLMGAGLLVRSFRAQVDVSPGFDVHDLVAFSLSLPRSRYPRGTDVTMFADELLRRVRETPGVSSASISSNLPFRGGSHGVFVRTDEDPDVDVRVWWHSVSPSTLQTLGERMRSGRFIDADDREGGQAVVVIGAAMAKRVFGGDDPVGRRIYLGSDTSADNAAEIVGVLQDVRYRDLTQSLMAETNSPDVYLSFAQLPSRSIEVAARVTRDPVSTLSALRHIVTALDPALPVYQANSLEDDWRAQTARPRFAASLMTVFSVLAAVLACVGIYGVLAFAVGQRGREIAVRRAIGASAGSVARSIVGDGLQLVLVGLVAGLVLTLAAGRVLRGLLFGIGPDDPATLMGVASLMVLAGALAAALPAWRATRRDPAAALSAE